METRNEGQPKFKVCTFCGDTFKVTASLSARLTSMGYDDPVRCTKCNAMKKEVITLKCHDCNNDFTLSMMQKAIMQKKFGEKYRDPLYCKKCRTQWISERGKKHDKRKIVPEGHPDWEFSGITKKGEGNKNGKRKA